MNRAKYYFGDRPINPIFITLLAVHVLAWGIWFACFNVFAASSAYDFMATIAPQWVWAVAALSIGISKLSTIFTGDVVVSKVTAFIAVFFWAFIAVSYAIGNYQSVSVLSASMWSLFNIWLYLNAALTGISLTFKRPVRDNEYSKIKGKFIEPARLLLIEGRSQDAIISALYSTIEDVEKEIEG